MLQGIGTNDLLQLDADLQMLLAALSNPNVQGIGIPTSVDRVTAIQQKIAGWIAGESAVTVAVLQAKLKRTQDQLQDAQQKLAQSAVSNT